MGVMSVAMEAYGGYSITGGHFTPLLEGIFTPLLEGILS